MTALVSINSIKPLSFQNLLFRARKEPERKLASFCLRAAEQLNKEPGLLDNLNTGTGADFLRFLKNVSNGQDTFWTAFQKEYEKYINSGGSDSALNWYFKQLGKTIIVYPLSKTIYSSFGKAVGKKFEEIYIGSPVYASCGKSSGGAAVIGREDRNDVPGTEGRLKTLNIHDVIELMEEDENDRN